MVIKLSNIKLIPIIIMKKKQILKKDLINLYYFFETYLFLAIYPVMIVKIQKEALLINALLIKN